MKTTLKTLFIGITTTLFLTGCGMSEQPVLPSLPKVEKTENGIIKINQKINVYSKEVDAEKPSQSLLKAFKIGYKVLFTKASKETLEQGKTHFILISNVNGLNGFPITDVNQLEEYCIANYLTKELSNKCDFGLNKNYMEISILPLNNPDYTIPAFDAKLVLEEIK
jgi:hypothetical protein